MKTNVLSLASLLLCLSVQQSQAKGKDAVVYSYKPVSSNHLYHSKKNGKMLAMQAQLALRGNDVERAMKLGKRAVELSPKDMDSRIAYGEALYQMYEHDKSNSAVFNECVKIWLVVHRNIVGFEENTSYKGISIPLANKFFEDENHGILAKQRLESLCGRVPKFWETNTRYLKKVLVPESKVKGKIVSLEQDSKTEDATFTKDSNTHTKD